jgi:NAD(P)-dependent dehydrogenase (short-subunit alcohol dehydrogenase family)
MMNFRLDGRVALVTGALGGIGAAICRRLTEAGAVVIASDIPATVDGHEHAPAGSWQDYLSLDVTRQGDWASAMEAIEARHGVLHILVHNAGRGYSLPFEDTSFADWRSLYDVNVDGVFLGCQEAIRFMKRSAAERSWDSAASIIIVSSVVGIVGQPYASAYASTKGASRILSKSLALYCAQHDYRIRVNSIHPGVIDTPLLHADLQRSENPDAAFKQVNADQPIGHIGRPDDIAFGAVYLASPAAAFVLGSELIIDGGYTAQ